MSAAGCDSRLTPGPGLLLADLPKAAGSRVVFGGGRGPHPPAVGEIAPALAFRLGRVGQPDQRLRTLLRGAREGADQRHAQRHQGPIVAVEAAGHDARMDAESVDAAALYTAGECAREEDVGQLGLGIAPESIGAICPLPCEVVKG